MARAKKVRAGAEKVAVAYIRASTAEQSLSPEAQLSQIRTWATARGVSVASVFEDLAVSGSADLEDRPGLLAALDGLSAHGAGLLVVAKRDRLARSVFNAGAIEAACAARGARVATADGLAEGEDPASILLRQLLDAVGQFELSLIRGRTKAALQAKRAHGERVGSVPVGMRQVQDGRLVPDEHEKFAMAMASRLRAAGMPLRAIGRHLELEGYRNRRGGVYAAESVAGLLRASATSEGS